MSQTTLTFYVNFSGRTQIEVAQQALLDMMMTHPPYYNWLVDRLGQQRCASPCAASETLVSSFLRSHSQPANRDDGNTCSVCLSELTAPPVDTSVDASGAGEGKERDEFVVQLQPCAHMFHAPCLRPWLRKHQTCPMCRCAIKLVE